MFAHPFPCVFNILLKAFGYAVAHSKIVIQSPSMCRVIYNPEEDLHIEDLNFDLYNMFLWLQLGFKPTKELREAMRNELLTNCWPRWRQNLTQY